MIGMQLSARLGALFALVFAAVCLWFALDGFGSPAEMDPEPISGGRAFAWFWAFLAVVGFAIAWLSWKLGK